MQKNISTRTALITGVSRPIGLGFAVASQLAEAGYHVIVTAREVAQAEVRASELRQAGLNVTSLGLDLADVASISKAADQLGRAINHLDILVNNASAMPDFETQSALAVDLGALHTAFETNVFGCWGLIQALLALLQSAPAARIVNVTSAAAGQVGKRAGATLYSPAYSMAKHTLNVLTQTLAAALADTAILINAVDPGSVATHPERGIDPHDRTPADAARDVVRVATLGPDGPTGALFVEGAVLNLGAL